MRRSYASSTHIGATIAVTPRSLPNSPISTSRNHRYPPHSAMLLRNGKKYAVNLAERRRAFASWTSPLSEPATSARRVCSKTLSRARKTTPAPYMWILTLTANRSVGCCNSRMRLITTPRKLNLSEGHPPVLAVPSEILCQAEDMYIRLCVLPVRRILRFRYLRL